MSDSMSMWTRAIETAYSNNDMLRQWLRDIWVSTVTLDGKPIVKRLL